MIDGIYGTRFTSNGQDYGGGVVVIDGTAVHGGDPDYLYRGQYWIKDQDSIEATVQVQNYTGRLNALVGPLSSFVLTVTGMADSQTMRLLGAVNGRAQGTIQIILTKISDLVDPSRGCFDAACAVVATAGFEGPGTRSPHPPQVAGMIEKAEVKRLHRKTRSRYPPSCK
jgi:hypothetical protein